MEFTAQEAYQQPLKAFIGLKLWEQPKLLL
jgi:hypothetical protein